MENSRAYNYLIEQINATGSKKLDGYYPNILEEIYEWEREEVENIIWNEFCNNKDTDLSIFLPKLKNYDGIKELEATLQKCEIPSRNSLNIALALWKSNNDEKYLEVFKENINNSKEEQKTQIIAMLVYCDPDERIYDILVPLYINSENSTVRSTALTGILHCKGYIKNPLDTKEIVQSMKLRKLFLLNEKEDRRKMIHKLNLGELEYD